MLKNILMGNAEEVLLKYLEKNMDYHQKVETVPLWEAGGRVLAADIIANEDFPVFDRSSVDGFAVLSADTCNASNDNPTNLIIIDKIAAGSYPYKKLLPGTAIKIFTGAPLPLDADSVIKKEEAVEINLDSVNAVVIRRPISIGENISVKGEDISAGEYLFSCRSVLTSGHIRILATLGIDPITVFARPQIGIFSTGNELVDLNDSLQYGQIRASNLYTLAAIIRQAGGIPVNLGVVRDRVDDVKQIYEKAERLKLPLVISTGGTASGDYDVIKDAMEASKCIRLFDKTAIRTAPFVASVKGKQLLVGLSGNPAGATFAMFLFLFPLISKLAGEDKQLPRGRGKLTTPISRDRELEGVIWGRFEERAEGFYVTPLEHNFCCSSKTHVNSNCLIELPAGKVCLSVNDIVSFRGTPY